MEISNSMVDKLSHLSTEQFLIFSALLDEFSRKPDLPQDVSKRIGVAENINFPADFDEIDYETENLFDL